MRGAESADLATGSREGALQSYAQAARLQDATAVLAVQPGNAIAEEGLSRRYFNARELGFLMRIKLRLLLLSFLVPGLAAAQGLGDVAARERQKREAAGPRAKPRVLSNDDLRKEEAGKPASQADADAPESTSSSHQATREQEQSPQDDEAAARQAQTAQAQAEVDSARAAVVAAEARVKELGDKLNPMSPSFIYGAAQTGDAGGEEIRTREALRQAQAQLAQARDALVRANRSHEDVRRGRPAGSSESR